MSICITLITKLILQGTHISKHENVYLEYQQCSLVNYSIKTKEERQERKRRSQGTGKNKRMKSKERKWEAGKK